jgi:hypothetical protein
VCTYLRFGQHCSCYSRLLCSLEFVSSRRTISAILRTVHTTSATLIHCRHFTGGRSSSSVTAVLCNRVESPQLPQQQSPNSNNLRLNAASGTSLCQQSCQPAQEQLGRIASACRQHSSGAVNCHSLLLLLLLLLFLLSLLCCCLLLLLCRRCPRSSLLVVVAAVIHCCCYYALMGIAVVVTCDVM